MSLAALLTFATLLQALVFCAVLAAPGYRERLSNRFLIACMLAMVIEKSDQLFLQSGLVFDYPQFAMIGNVFGAAIVPLIYLHVRARADTAFRLSWQEWYAALPVSLLALYVFGTYHLLPLEEKQALFNTGEILNAMNAYVIPIAGDVVLLIFLGASIRVLQRHDQAVLNWFSNTQDRTFGGIRTVLLLVSAMILLHMLWTITGQGGFGLVLGLSHFILVNALGLAAFRQAPDEAEIPALRETGDTKAADLQPVLQAVTRTLEDETLYLDPDLTIARLARHAGERPRMVSEAINTLGGTNFYELVNGYRIRAAQARLKADHAQSILDTAYACGFNSKSAFNTAFKRIAGVTPSAWRERQRSDLRSA